MSSQTSAQVADKVAWSKLYSDYQLLQTVLDLLRSQRLQNSCEEGAGLDNRVRLLPIEQQLQDTVADTIELLRALDEGHTLNETWQPQLHSSHIVQIRALGTVLVNTYADRIQQVRYRTNDLILQCARMYIWHQCANTDELASYRFLSRWEQLDEQVRFIEGQSSSRAVSTSSFVGHGNLELLRRDLEVLEREWVNRLGSVPDFVRASLAKLNDLPGRRDSGTGAGEMPMVRRNVGIRRDSARDMRVTRRIVVRSGTDMSETRPRRNEFEDRRDSRGDMPETRMIRRSTGGSLIHRPRVSRSESEDDSDDRGDRRRTQSWGQNESRGVQQGRERGPLEHFLRETGAGLGATVGRGLDTLVREGKKEVTDFFLR